MSPAGTASMCLPGRESPCSTPQLPLRTAPFRQLRAGRKNPPKALVRSRRGALPVSCFCRGYGWGGSSPPPFFCQPSLPGCQRRGTARLRGACLAARARAALLPGPARRRPGPARLGRALHLGAPCRLPAARHWGCPPSRPAAEPPRSCGTPGCPQGSGRFQQLRFLLSLGRRGAAGAVAGASGELCSAGVPSARRESRCPAGGERSIGAEDSRSPGVFVGFSLRPIFPGLRVPIINWRYVWSYLK